MRLELLHVLLFVVCNILDEPMPRLILFLFLVKIVCLVLSTSSETHLVVAEPIALFLPQLLGLFLVSLLLCMIDDLEFGILTDYKRFRCLYLLRHLDPILERLLDVGLDLIHEPFELIRSIIVCLLI